MCASGVQEEVKITLDCSQADFIAYDKMVISLKGGEMCAPVYEHAFILEFSLLTNIFLLLQIRVNPNNRWNEECAGI